MCEKYKNSQAKFHIRLKTNNNLLSLQKKQNTKLSSQKIDYHKQPSIGKMFVLELQNNHNQRKTKQIKPLKLLQHRILKEISTNFQSVNQKKFATKELLTQNFDQLETKRQSIHLSNKQKRNFKRNLSQSKKGRLTLQQYENDNNLLKVNGNSQSKIKSISYEKTDKNQSNGIQVSTQTDNTQIDRESYQQYLKFKITKKQKYEKFKNLFQFIQNLTSIQNKNIKKNINQFQEIFNNNLNEQRQKRVSQLMKTLPSNYHNFNVLFKQIIGNEKKLGKQLLQNQKNIHILTRKLLKQVQQKILQLMTQKQIFAVNINPRDIKDVFNFGFRKNDAIFQQTSILCQKRISYFKQNSDLLQIKYKQWQKNIFQQSTLIKNCVMNIVELPQLSINLFGMDKSKSQDQTNNQIKRFCLNNKNMPHISDFFLSKNHPNQKEIDQVFSKCCDIKCMNCIYLRNKMKYIYEKNEQVKPIVKVLMHLIKPQITQPSFLQKLLTQN